MRVNRFVATASGLSRRAADIAVSAGRVRIGDQAAGIGDQVGPADTVTLDGNRLELSRHHTIILHKPIGYVTSRRQQGTTPTIYALLPPSLHQLKSIGRLDRDSSGVLLLTNDGALAQQLQHPSGGKTKHYLVWLDKPLDSSQLNQLRAGVRLDDGVSAMAVEPQADHYTVTLQEGRNRQIRRSFAALGLRVTKLHRTAFGRYRLGDLKPGDWRELADSEDAA
jgi:23S rRNA pseudouridine2605 synthase